MLLAFGFPAGILVRCVLIRFWATLCHVRIGIPRFAENWTNLAFRTDLFTPPELIPGLPSEHTFNFKSLFNNKNRKSVIFWIVAAILFTPSVVYRLYLKSTAWLYLPVLWLIHVPPIHREEKGGPLVLLRDQKRSYLEMLSTFSSFAALGYFIWRLYDPSSFLQAAAAADAQGLPVTPLHILSGLDISGLEAWYWLPLLAALCAVVVFFWSNALNTRFHNRTDYTPHQLALWSIVKLNSAKNYLTIAWMIIGFYSLIISTHCKLPSGLSDLINQYLTQNPCT